MEGARQFSGLFKTGQYGRLYIVSGGHARGSTFHIYVLPKDEEAIRNGWNNGPGNKNAVEVYGIIDGQPGWTESYGWLHAGNWQNDFRKLVERRRKEIEDAKNSLEINKSKEEKQEATRQKELLDSY